MIELNPIETTEVETQLKEESKEPKKSKKVSKLTFIVSLFKGEAPREGDIPPAFPMTDIKELAEKVKEAENSGYFRVRTDTKVERNDAKYLGEVKWYLTQAAKKGLIDREYNPRKKRAE